MDLWDFGLDVVDGSNNNILQKGMAPPDATERVQKEVEVARTPRSKLEEFFFEQERSSGEQFKETLPNNIPSKKRKVESTINTSPSVPRSNLPKRSLISENEIDESLIVKISQDALAIPSSVHHNVYSSNNNNEHFQPLQFQQLVPSSTLRMDDNERAIRVVHSDLQQLILQTCDLKVQRLSLVKQILDSKSHPEIEEDLKLKHQEIFKQELALSNEINKLQKIHSQLKEQTKGSKQSSSSIPPSPSLSNRSKDEHLPFEQLLWHSQSEQKVGTTPQPLPSLAVPSDDLPDEIADAEPGAPPGTRRVLTKVWAGKLALENCPSKGKSKDIYVGGYAPNLTGLNVAQFEEKSSPANECGNMESWPTTLRISGVCDSNNLHFFKKYSLRMFVLFPDVSPNDNAETFTFLLQQLNKNAWAGVVELPENTLLLVPFRQEKLLGIILTKMNVALATTKPSIPNDAQYFPTIDIAYKMSLRYHHDGELRFDTKMVDGFYDPGRFEFLPLEEHERIPGNSTTREVLLVDSRKDNKLCSIMQRAEEMVNSFADVESQARVLSLFVSNCFGGDFPNSDRCAQEISRLKQIKQSNVILIGELSSGVCRHRAVLYKYLCDRLGIDCELKRGNYSSNNITGGHAWNLIKLGTSYFVVDIMHEPTQLYPIESEKAKNYTRVGNVGGILRSFSSPPVLRPELSSRRFVRLPNLREKAVFHERLGRGGYGSVYRITLGGLSCALKKIRMGSASDQLKQYALQEVQIMEMLQHENIIHYLGHELVEESQELHILMELFPLSLGQLIEKRRIHGNSNYSSALSAFMSQPAMRNNSTSIVAPFAPLGIYSSTYSAPSSTFKPFEIKHLAIEILNGIDYLHSNHIVHRDLKPGNILVDMDENGRINKVKITDFGVCVVGTFDSSQNNGSSCVGTELFMAPEVHNTGNSTPKADIWSFGMVLVELVTLMPPYYGMNKELALQHIKSGIPPPLPDYPEMPESERKIIGIIKTCLQYEPEKRPTAEQLVIAFFRLQCAP